ncbi:hypothetical protein M8997_006405 [Phyllobacterium sp. 21LDTY02-6]|jgi:hypothetical protein|uniref:hypothetical protein n=1 Tax=unclassified Phyllobacterium TaxID=2638441 RepID=UPI002020225E|nr:MULTISPECIES: hypothetical protein [unclassified Phyllobacterium]MCO4316809.1 hypothetical protein [Phyllobacterium sp. 21LDTY02-6]MCX8281619.1 hypothetical protein [Phyllobacterium sp. 0TCS1.6C]MCX8294729.1 hypothetical protein [Phyllobacterium sp. 0TCS1.6A]
MTEETHAQTVHLVVADVWKDKNEEPKHAHLLLVTEDTDGLVDLALRIFAAQGYEEAELHEIGSITEEPDEEPHRSAYKNALTGQAALIEFEE